MTNDELLVVRNALSILDREYNTGSDKDKVFVFTGEKRQAEAFKKRALLAGVESNIVQSEKYDNVWSATTREIDSIEYDNLCNLRTRVFENH